MVSFNLSENPGVQAPQQYVDGVIQLNFDQEPEMEPMTNQGDIAVHVTGLIMSNQFSLKKGLELFGDKAEAATGNELQQIHDMDTYTPMHPNELSREEKTKAL